MKPDVFFFDDYKSFLSDLIEKNSDVKGYRTRLAKAAHCQKSFLSQVMAGKVHLTPDHAAHIAAFLAFSPEESEYLIDLVTLARAGSPALKRLVSRRLERRKGENRKLSNRFTDAYQIDFKHHEAFYGQWFVSAIYMLLGHTQDTRAIALRLALPEEVVASTLKTLEQMGLTETTSNGEIRKTQANLFLRDSPFRYNFRSSWRNVGLLRSQLPEPDSSFYTSLWSVSQANSTQMLRMFSDTIAAAGAKALEPQNEEKLICVNFDFFSI